MMHKIKVKPITISKEEEFELFKVELDYKLDKTLNNLIKTKDKETLKKIHENYDTHLIKLKKKLIAIS